MKKKVLVIHRGYPLGVDAGDKVRTLNMVTSLQHMGYHVILLGFFTKGFAFLRKEKKSLPSDLKAILLYSLPNRMGLAKVAELYRAIVTYAICRYYSIDIIQAELSCSATCARFVSRIPLITDFHSDIVPELEMGGYSPSIVRHAQAENMFALKHSVKTITVSNNLCDNLSAYGKVLSHNFILPCNFNAEPFIALNPDTREELRAQYGISDRIVLCYSGGFHVWQCIKETLELIIRLRALNPRYYLCLFTNDSTTPYLDLLAQLEGHYMVKGLGRTEIPAYLSMADAGFVMRGNSLVNINSSPTKTSEYLAAGAMVIATRYSGDAPRQIEESTCGVVLDELYVSDQELSKLNEQIIHYAQNYKAGSAKAKSYVFEHRIWASNENKLVSLYNQLNEDTQNK